MMLPSRPGASWVWPQLPSSLGGGRGGAVGRSEGAVVSVLGAEVLGACCCVVELGTVAWQEDDFVFAP